MYKIEWDTTTGGVLLRTRNTGATLGIAPRPVFWEELQLLEMDKMGWTFPHCEEPLMWAVNKQYWYRGRHLFDAKGADIYTKPTLVFEKGVEPENLKPVDVEAMIDKNNDLMFVLENEAIEFIRDTFATYTRATRTYDKTDTNQLDYEALRLRAEKRSKQKMAVVKQDCDSFDVMPLDAAQQAGKRVLLSTHIDRFIASFSGGKDSQVVLDLCTRAIPPTDFEVVYSDTGYELPSSLALYEKVKQFYGERFPQLHFLTARNHESVLHYWDLIGTPSDTHRWCCSIMKTAPLYRLLRVTGGGKQPPRILTFDGVRAEESIRRENYQRIGKGKHTAVYNAHPILRWNAVEIFLYLFQHKLIVNEAYRAGVTRVGCVVCPFSVSWNDGINNRLYGTSVSPFIDKLRKYSSQISISGFDNYLREGKWKLKPLGDRCLVIPNVVFKTESPLSFVAEVVHPRQSFFDWLPALGTFTRRDLPEGSEGELHYKGNVFPYKVSGNDERLTFSLNGQLNNELIFLLRRLAYKTAYCVHCEVCEVDCPTGALTTIPNINIDINRCIHCLKCFNTHDRGCIAADCTRMMNDTEKKLSQTIHGYKNFGMRDEWVDAFLIDPLDFWNHNTLGKPQLEGFRAWLRDAEITDEKNNLTNFGQLMQNVYRDNPLLFWEVAYINLSYQSFIVQWICNHVDLNTVYNKKYVKEEVAQQGFNGSLTTVENAATAFINLAKQSPVGEDLRQGIVVGKEGLKKEAYDDLSMEAVAYSVYKYAQVHEVNMLRVSDFYRKGEEHGPYQEFRISEEALKRKLRALSSDNNRVLVAELNMGLDHITIREDLTPMKVLEMLAL